MACVEELWVSICSHQSGKIISQDMCPLKINREVLEGEIYVSKVYNKAALRLLHFSTCFFNLVVASTV